MATPRATNRYTSSDVLPFFNGDPWRSKPWKKIATLNGIPLHLKNFEIFGINMLEGDRNQMNKLQRHLLVNEDAQKEALINEDGGECIEQND